MVVKIISSIFNTIFSVMFRPLPALIIFTIFLISYLIFLDEEGAFNETFLRFGPSKDPTKQTKFLNMTIDSWQKVIIMYIVGFLTAILTSYYSAVMDNFIHMYAWNPAVKAIPASRFETYLTLVFSPLLYQTLAVIQFFMTMTMQLQFLLPQLIGSYLIFLPYDIYRVSKKTFDAPRD